MRTVTISSWNDYTVGTSKVRLPDDEAYEKLQEEWPEPEWAQLDGCCGVTEIREFPEKFDEDNEVWFYGEYLRRESFSNAYGQAGIRLITLNQNQEDKFGKTVRKLGYKKKASAVNPKTKNNIYVYLLTVHPIKKRNSKLGKRRFE